MESMELNDDSITTRCRCCYEALAGKLLQQYSSAVYYQMLQNTFAITLSSKVGESEGTHICPACLQRLRDASDFRRLVLSTEQRFQQLLSADRLQADGLSDLKQELDLEVVGDEEPPTYDVAGFEEEHNDDTDEMETPQVSQSETSKLMENVKSALVVAERTRRIHREARPQLNLGKLRLVNRYVRKLMEKEGDNFKVPFKPVTLRSAAAADRAAPVKRTIPPPRFKPLSKSIRSKPHAEIDPNAINTVGPGLLPAEKRAARRIIKQNALAILKNTTACPFIYYHSNFRCFYCRETFFDFSMLRCHTIEIHNNVKQEARKISAFRDLMMVDIASLKCRRCDKEYADIESIKEHLITTHNVAIDRKHKDDIAAFKLDANNFKCHICNEVFHVFRNLSLHLNKHYANYMCDVCGKPFISWERYKNHENTHTMGHYPCTKCDLVFDTIKERASHSMAKHRITRYGCPLCSERFDKYLERTVHMSVAHGVTHKFKCPQCPKEYFHKPHLRAHVSNTHRPREKKVECRECGMLFTDNNALSRHSVSHTGEKLFGCKVCGKKYGRKYSLTEHMRAHSKPHARSRPAHLMSF